MGGGNSCSLCRSSNTTSQLKYKEIDIKHVKQPVPIIHSDLESEMLNVVNLKPGENTKFLFYTVYCSDLKISPPIDIKYFTEICRWSIDDDYLNDALKKAEYIMYATCTSSSQNITGIKAFALMNSDTTDSDAMYLSLLCNAEIYSDEHDRYVHLRLGQLMFLGLLNYSRIYLGKKHVYNHAGDINLVSLYGRNHWKLGDKLCDQLDEVSINFPKPSDYQKMEAYTLDFISKGKIIQTNHGTKMKLCNFNFNILFAELMEHTYTVINSFPHGTINNTLCHFA